MCPHWTQTSGRHMLKTVELISPGLGMGDGLLLERAVALSGLLWLFHFFSLLSIFRVLIIVVPLLNG